MFLSALLLILSFPPFDLGFLALVALVPWLQSLEGVAPRVAWRRGYWLGLLFFGGTMWWLVHVTLVGLAVLVAALALYFAAFSVFAAWQLRQSSSCHSLLLAATLASTWTLLEWLRGTLFSGLGWNLLAHTQWHSPLVQIADLVGAYGVSWLVVFVNVAVWQAWRRRCWPEGRTGAQSSAGCWRPAAAAGLVLALVVGYGAVRRAAVERALARGPVVRVALVQGNIPQSQKWDVGFLKSIMQRYEALTRQAALAGAQLIVWPETAVPALANTPEFQAWLGHLSLEVKVPLLVGAPWGAGESASRLMNSALLVTPDGRLADRYDKMHLVPFGEFIPGEAWWPGLGRVRDWLPIGEFTPGTRAAVFDVPTAPSLSLSTLICFEDLFPAISRTMVRHGARLLVTITNDAWFGRTAAPIQHAQASTLRAIESRVWMLRAANTGFSCAIDPTGRITAQQPLWVPGVVVAPITLGPAGPTLYTRLGDWWLLLCAALLTLLAIRRVSKN